MKCNLFVYTELEYTSMILMLLMKNCITYSRQKIVNLSRNISQKYHQITTNNDIKNFLTKSNQGGSKLRSPSRSVAPF